VVTEGGSKMTMIEKVHAAISKLKEVRALLESADLPNEAQKADDLAAEVNAHTASLQAE
jgi:hypothetical protein